MKQTLIIVGTEAARISTLKGEIIQYLGTRMIDDTCGINPGLYLNQELADKDITYLNSLVNEIDSSLSIIIFEGLLNGPVLQLKPLNTSTNEMPDL